MKTVNVKRLAVLAAGAAMVGAAFAAAAVPEVDDAGLGAYKFFVNGQPNVKIAVGAAAAASDGIAAGNIAAMIANLAYKDVDVVITGKDAVTCGAGAGTCGDMKATLDITVPGAAAVTGSTTLSSPLTDYLDYDSSYASTRGSAGDAIKVTNENYPTVAYKTTVSDVTGGKTYTENEEYLVSAQNYFDEAADYKQLVMAYPNVTYTLKFDPEIMYHTAGSNSTYWDNRDAYKTELHSVKIRFLGQDYTITKLQGTGGADISTSLAAIKVITLGVGAMQQVLSVGDSATVGNVTVTLKNILKGGTAGTIYGGEFDVTDAAGTDKITLYSTVIDATTETKKTTKGVTVEVAAGSASYMKVNVYSTGIKLTDADYLEFVGDPTKTDINRAAGTYVGMNKWKAYIKAGATTSAGAPTIKEIQLVLAERGTTTAYLKYKAGEAFSLINDPKIVTLKFLGKETGVSEDTISITPSVANTTYTTDAGALTCVWATISSAAGNYFQVGSGLSRQTIYYNPCNNKAYYANLTTANYTEVASGYPRYIYQGEGTNEYASVWFKNETGVVGGGGTANLYGTIVFQEGITEPLQAIATYHGNFSVTINSTHNQGYVVLKSTDPNTIDYAATGLTLSAPTSVQKDFITPRGTSLSAVDKTQVVLKYPKRALKVKYTFGLEAVTAGVPAGAVRKTLAKGEKATVDSTEVSVADLTGTCAAGAGAVQGLDGLATDPAKANVVVELSPASPLVVSDAEAAGVAQVIAVGGPLVNEVTKAALPEATYKFEEGKAPIVKVVGSKIVVAGWTAQDTKDAAQALVNWLSGKRATIRS